MAKKPISTNQRPNHQIVSTSQTLTHYQGAIPHPDILSGFETIVPGAAERIIKLAEEESHHRRNLEIMAMNANIASQEKQALLAQQQNNSVFRSDLIGQIAGFVVCLACIGGAVYLGMHKHDELAGALAIIPTAALIKAFILKK